MEYTLKDYSKMFKALSDETRLKILVMLSKNEELCACKILECFEITQPTLSYHMKILMDSGLVFGEKDGFWMHYRVNFEATKDLKEFFDFHRE